MKEKYGAGGFYGNNRQAVFRVIMVNGVKPWMDIQRDLCSQLLPEEKRERELWELVASCIYVDQLVLLMGDVISSSEEKAGRHGLRRKY